MEVKRINIDGVNLRALIVDENDPTRTCENCGKQCYDHPLLAKEDKDWCINCTDEMNRTKMTDRELGLWTLMMDSKGYITMVVTEKNQS